MERPNIVFILIDDMGWRDLGCYGSVFYETPHIDALAARGMRFTEAYASCPVCSPTRASLLTGRYPARIGVTDFINWNRPENRPRGKVISPFNLDRLPPEAGNYAKAFHAAGYATWHVGKWHLGSAPYYPDQQGFDVNIGGWEVGCPTGEGYFSPYGNPTLPDGPEGEHLSDRLTDEAIRLLREREKGKPFFLNFWTYDVHTPLQGKPELIAKYEAKAREMGLDQVDAIEEGEAFPGEHKKDYRVTRRKIQSDPVYAAMIETLDTNIGRLVATLEEEGELERTIFVFTSDNGGLSTAEGWPTSNLPLSEGKGWMYDGGVREPFFVVWPGVVEAESVSEETITSPDLYPTLLEMAGLPLRPDEHVDGVSLAPVLRGEGGLDREAIFWHYPHYGNQGGSPGSSVRTGDWKLIEFYEDGKRELYNLREDIGETNDRAEEKPEIADRLQRMLAEWKKGIDAKLPEPNPDYAPWPDRGTGHH